MKKALIHDWYYVNGGAEKVVQSINNIWKDFDHYALIDFLSDKDRQEILNGSKVNTSFIQKLPTAKNNHRKFLQLFPLAIKQFDLREYDLIISSSSSVAKGVKTHEDQTHICYCHSPMRYAWDLEKQYLEELNLTKGIKYSYVKWLLNKMREWDLSSNKGVNYFIANSNYVAERIERIYERKAEVIYPPVDINSFKLEEVKDDYYLTVSRLVSYKKIRLIVEAFNSLPLKKLVVIGDGPEMINIKKIAGDNIEILGYLTHHNLIKYMQKAKAFVFAAEEDFGITSVEAQACGTPVIAFKKGGSRESIIENETGIFFEEQTTNALIKSIHNFESIKFDYGLIRKNAERFSGNRFKREFYDFVEDKIKNKF